MSKVVAKGKSSRRLTLRFRKRDVEHNLLAATQAWLRARGGDALVIGGIGIVDEDPWLRPHNFYVAVKVTGRKPQKASSAGQTEEK